jgi:glutamate N-acetyltransferase/amino-acid N-acetyltransferase
LKIRLLDLLPAEVTTAIVAGGPVTGLGPRGVFGPEDPPAAPARRAGRRRRQLHTHPTAGLGASPDRSPARLSPRSHPPAPARHDQPPPAAAMPPPSLLHLHSRAPLQPRPFRMNSRAAPSRVVVCSVASAEGFISAAPILLPDGPWKQVTGEIARLPGAGISEWALVGLKTKLGCLLV